MSPGSLPILTSALSPSMCSAISVSLKDQTLSHPPPKTYGPISCFTQKIEGMGEDIAHFPPAI